MMMMRHLQDEFNKLTFEEAGELTILANVLGASLSSEINLSLSVSVSVPSTTLIISMWF